VQTHHILRLVALLSAILTAGVRADTPPKEENCRMAITAQLDTLQSPLPNPGPRDEADRKRLLAEMEALVEASRRQGMTECQTWSRMMGKAFNQ
jgi:hypothetical protein